MKKLTRKTKELTEAILIIGVARGEGVSNSTHDEKKEKIKQHIDNLTKRQIDITKETCIDFISWYAACQRSEYKTFEIAFDAFEKQYTEECNVSCGMNYCDENGCTDRERQLTGSFARPEINEDNHF